MWRNNALNKVITANNGMDETIEPLLIVPGVWKFLNETDILINCIFSWDDKRLYISISIDRIVESCNITSMLLKRSHGRCPHIFRKGGNVVFVVTAKYELSVSFCDVVNAELYRIHVLGNNMFIQCRDLG